ncbi:hypothetical protein WJX72_002052 [[Myrmecia] bisecta]|uniref:Cationic amino acid transporter n=1 Tax=[Myrmecia] bisecta TaxID=41462 RepID=A0AAW1PSC0_9CHLO
MKRCLGAVDLVMLGIGAIIGAGVFVLTGVAAAEHAGPAVVVSFLVAAFAALLSALSYTEFVVDLPIAGSAFNYISLTFGELAAWVVACNLILEYTLSAAAVARGFSAYMATLLGLHPTDVLIPLGIVKLDIMAFCVTALLAILLAKGTQESSRFNMVVSGSNLLVILFVICAAAPFAHTENLHPFAPFGVRGIFTAASVVFFSFIGFDTVATCAEETRNPAVDLPIGVIGSLLICAAFYVLMCLAICLMMPYSQIDINAPFSTAFLDIQSAADSTAKRGLLNFSARFVSFGAVTGIITSLLGTLIGQARIYVVLGRDCLLPPWLAVIHGERGTPVNATLLTGVTAGLLALLVDLEALAELVSIGTLFVFCMVSAGGLWRRYYAPGATRLAPLALALLSVVGLSIALSASYTFEAPVPVLVVFAVLWLLAAASLAFLPVAFVPTKFAVPLTPFTPALGILATIHLIGSLGWPAYVRFVVWLVVSLVVYALYSVHKAEERDRERVCSDCEELSPGRPQQAVDYNAVAEADVEVELGYKPGKQHADSSSHRGSGSSGGTPRMASSRSEPRMQADDYEAPSADRRHLLAHQESSTAMPRNLSNKSLRQAAQEGTFTRASSGGSSTLPDRQ